VFAKRQERCLSGRTKALAAVERMLVSGNCKTDLFVEGEKE